MEKNGEGRRAVFPAQLCRPTTTTTTTTYHYQSRTRQCTDLSTLAVDDYQCKSKTSSQISASSELRLATTIHSFTS